MHAAPSVTYPVGRSAFAGALLAMLVLLAAAVVAAWTLQSGAPGVRHALGAGAVLACAAPAFAGWLRSPRGALCWNGAEWEWRHSGGTATGDVELALDLQSRMLLRWDEGGRPRRWLWLERKSDVSHWDALRRAVYSRASTPPVQPAGKPPAAEQ